MSSPDAALHNPMRHSVLDGWVRIICNGYHARGIYSSRRWPTLSYRSSRPTHRRRVKRTGLAEIAPPQPAGWSGKSAPVVRPAALVAQAAARIMLAPAVMLIQLARCPHPSHPGSARSHRATRRLSNVCETARDPGWHCSRRPRPGSAWTDDAAALGPERWRQRRFREMIAP